TTTNNRAVKSARRLLCYLTAVCTDEKANKAAFRLMFPTVLFMMPAVFGFLMGPAILELQQFFDDGGLDALSASGDLSSVSTNLRQATINPQ
ncbi:MAG: hypothetical protein O3B68_19685, partial [Planctomycetota bacterium]|nr:hypothetical protein [Planctomycetota bacterium]